MSQNRSQETSYIPGSDGAGIITELGKDVTDFNLYDEVFINPSLDWHAVKDVPETPHVLGGPSNGTFAEYIVIPSKKYRKKTGLSFMGRSRRIILISSYCLSGIVYQRTA